MIDQIPRAIYDPPVGTRQSLPEAASKADLPVRRYVSATVRLLLAAFTIGALGFSAVAGLHGMANPQPRELTTPHAGACVALELAMAHGFLDEAKKRVVMRTLIDPRNPYAGRFGTSYVALSQTCALVFAHRWSP